MLVTIELIYSIIGTLLNTLEIKIIVNIRDKTTKTTFPTIGSYCSKPICKSLKQCSPVQVYYAVNDIRNDR